MSSANNYMDEKLDRSLLRTFTFQSTAINFEEIFKQKFSTNICDP